jgi:2OG-Fe(II) oxygenase superfamily
MSKNEKESHDVLNQVDEELLPGAFYVERVLAKDEATALFQEALSMDLLSQTYGITGFRGPRLNIVGAVGADPERTFDKLPDALKNLVERLERANLMQVKPFQVTVNVYPSAETELVAHKDGVGDQVVIVSLGEHTVLEFSRHEHEPAKFTRVFPDAGDSHVCSLWLRHNSALRLTGASFLDFAHGITKRTGDRFESARFANAHRFDESDESIADGAVVPRGKRVSIVLWSSSSS